MFKKSLQFLLLLTVMIAPWGVKGQTLTVYDQGGTTNSNYVPMYGGYFDDYTKSEFVIPAAKLSDMEGGTITSMKFYIKEVSTYGNGWGNTHQIVFLKEVSSATLSSWSGTTGATTVFDGMFTVPASTDTEFEITFTNNYEYNGGNLLVGIYNTDDGDYRTVYWLGETVSGASGGASNGSSLNSVAFTQRNFIPKTTFTYEPAASGCDKPAALVADPIEAHSATLTWSGGSGTYNVQYKKVSDAEWTTVLSGTTLTTATINDALTANTEYEARVQSVCDGDPATSGWKAVSFNTPMFITYTGYTEDFESYSAVSNSTAGTMPPMWSSIYTGTSASYNVKVCNTTTYAPTGSGKYLFMSAGTGANNGSPNYAIMPAISNTYNNLSVEFDYKHQATSSVLTFGYMTNKEDAATFNVIEEVPASTTKAHYTKSLSGLDIPAGAYLAWRFSESTSSYKYIGIDNIFIKDITTFINAPTNIEVSGITTNSATISWNANGETAWKVQYSSNERVTWSDDIEVNTNSCNLTLEPGTSYYARVCAVKGGHTSDWYESERFSTDCYPTEIPYTGWLENFNSYTAQYTFNEGIMPECWNSIYIGTSSDYNIKVCNSTTYAPDGSSNYLFMIAGNSASYGSPNYAIMPVFESSFDNMVVEFDYKYQSTSSTLTFGYMTNKMDASTFSVIENVPESTTKAHYTKSLNGLNIPANAHLAWRFSETANSSKYLGIDNVFVKDVTTYINVPTNPQVTNITTNSATFSWDANGETEWKVQYSSDNQETWSNEIVVNDNTCSLSLAPGTIYYARVCAIKGGHTSSWCVSESFHTDCDAIAVTSLAYSYGFETDAPWLCWTNIQGATISNTDSGNSSPYQGSKYLKFSGNLKNYAALPEFAEATNTLQIKFWTRPENYSNSSCGTFDVGYMTDLEDTTTFVKIEKYKYNDWNAVEYIQKTVYFDNAPDDAYIAFRHNAGSTSWYWFVDDVEVSLAPLCRPVKNLAYSNVTNHSATITWAKGTEDQDTWQLKYNKGDDFDPNTEGTLVDNLNATTYTFNKTLDAASVYYIYVRANCGGEPSAWSNTVCTFTTGAAWPAPTTFTASNVTKNSVDLVWNSNGGDFLSGWDLYYVKSETAPEAPTAETSATETTVTLPTNEAPYQVTGLDPESRYYFWVRANHEGTTHSTWEALSGSYITTLIACHVPTGLAVSEIQPTSAKVTWNGDASGYNLRYRTTEAPTTATVILTAGDVWGDGSGYQMLLDADADQYGVAYNGGWTITDYSDFEYLIPTNADFDDNSTNVVFENSVAIQIPAGTYDWYITNPSAGDKVYVAGSNGNVPGSYDDYVFEAGKTYEFTMSLYSEGDGVTLTITGGGAKSGEPKEAAWIVIEDVTSPYTLPGLTEETNYEVQVQAVCGGEDGESAWSSSYNFATPSACDKPINLAVSALHESASLSWTGYQTNYNVQYRTAEIPAHLETFFFEDFENGIPNTWTILTEGTAPNANGWVTTSNGGSNVAISYSYHSSTNYNADNWLITPQINLQGSLKFKVRDNDDDSWNDEFEVLLSTTGTAKADFTTTLRAMQSPSETLTEIDPIDLSSYAGQQGYIAIHHLSSGQYYIIVDDFGIYGAEIPTVPAGEWISRNNVTSPCEITVLTSDTDYEWKVQGICQGATTTEWSNIISFTTLSETIIDDPEEMTNIAATECVIVKDGGVLTLTGTNSGNANNLIIEEGGQVIHTNAVQATLKKGIAASPSWGSKDAVSGWYLIASPVAGLSVACATTGDYDFYKYDEEHTQWLNQKVGANNITNFEQGIGYLYANKEATTIDYLGTLVGTSSTVTKALSYANTNDDQKGFNLMGNPFSCNITGNVTIGGVALTTYYAVEGGNELVERMLSEHPIKPGQGFMVQATAESQNLVFNPTAKDRNENKGYISIKAGNSEYVDNASIQIANGNTLRKMTLSDNSSIVYVMNGGKDYAAARIDALEGSMPVCFKANKLGSYTITIEAKDIKADYLHLIDNFTHEDIDLLLEPSYSFIASNGDNASRFTLVFRIEGSAGITNDIFAYQNGSDIVVNGEGELQVFDVMGRMVMTQRINGVETISAPTTGVYIFKLNEKTQKIIIR